MQHDRFPIGVSEHLKLYIYRLIDPRNGETFYVGKGKGDRVFQHAKGALTSDKDEDELDLKVQRIREIAMAGLEVVHVIHRHGIETEAIAFEVEAAVMDAYPGLANRVGGHGSGDFGPAHVDELIAIYAAQPFQPRENLILICITQSLEEGRDAYNAVRGVWKIDPDRAAKHRLVLAHDRGRVVGAFRPNGQWMEAIPENFPWLRERMQGRWGFVGGPAEQETANYYVGKRVPDEFRPKGAANPVRYISVK